MSKYVWCINTLRLRQNGRHFPGKIFKCIFLNENIWITIKISLKFVPKGPINNIPALVQVMAWCRPGDKPLSDPMMVKFTDAYMRHSASMSYTVIMHYGWENKHLVCLKRYIFHQSWRTVMSSPHGERHWLFEIMLICVNKIKNKSENYMLGIGLIFTNTSCWTNITKYHQHHYFSQTLHLGEKIFFTWKYTNYHDDKIISPNESTAYQEHNYLLAKLHRRYVRCMAQKYLHCQQICWILHFSEKN